VAVPVAGGAVEAVEAVVAPLAEVEFPATRVVLAEFQRA